MTNDYKVNLLKYLTDNLEIETGVNTPQFEDMGTISNNVYRYLLDKVQFPILYGNFNYLDTIIFYGCYLDNGNTYNGFIYITDSSLNPLGFITEFESGTELRPIISLNVDEDGYFYGFDNKNQIFDSDVDNSFRFIMLNKIIGNGKISGTYSVELRKSYYFPTDINSKITDMIEGRNRLVKKIGSADYYIIVDTSVNSVLGCGVVDLNISVNNGVTWKITINNDINNLRAISTYAIYEDNNITIKVDSQSSNYDFIDALYTPGDTPTFTTQYTINNPQSSFFDDILRIDEDTVYLTQRYKVDTTYYVVLYKANFTSQVLNIIHTFTVEETYVVGPDFRLYNIEDLLFFKMGYYVSNDVTDYACYIGMVINDTLYYINGDVFGGQVGGDFKPLIFISKVYNLITILSPLATTTQKIQLVYNPNNYNGLSYSDTNMLVPNSGQLYDDDSNLIFARNLYNKVVEDNMTVSTIQVPNTLLNGVNIANERLFGQTNSTLNNEMVSLSKNVYEYLNINFYNTLQIVNRNTSEDIINQTGASRINDSVSQTTDYDDATMNKAKINYGDGTNYIFPITFTQNGNDMETTFSIYASQEILSIDLISNDETTVYNTITGEFTVGNYYTITQDVTVEGVEL